MPRVTASGDGFAYVVIRDGADVMIHKYTSCSNGLVELAGFPRRVVSNINDPTCPLPGLDRCHRGLVVPTVAVDDTNPSHIYVAVAKSASGAAGNDDIIVIDSKDGGITWSGPVVVNRNVTARRFMPWVCAAAGNAYVGWYDRRAAAAAGAASNDLSDYFVGSATTRNGSLVSDGERNVTGTSDAQCASGWPTASDSTGASEQCTVQPQLGGACQSTAGMGSLTPCDYSSTACPAGESCKTGGGAPKYGDYNGIACGPDRVLATWASATAPAGFIGTLSPGITGFADVAIVNGNLTVVQRAIPANDIGRFNVAVDGGLVSSSMSNVTIGPIALNPTVPHRIAQSAAPPTTLPNYTVSISGDCDANGTVHFSALHPATCRIVNINRGYERCTSTCSAAEKECMAQAHTSSERQQCIADRNQCTDGCSQVILTVNNHVLPSIDAGKFNLMIDGVVRQAGAGDGDSTPDVTLAPGAHSVSQSAAAGTSLANYTTTIGGDCSATGTVSLIPGDHKACEITNTRRPGTGAEANLTVVKVVVPGTDPGRFNLRIDGVVRAPGIGNGGSTGSVVVSQGTHTVDEIGAGTNLSLYVRTFSGACDAHGMVTLAAGDSKTCTITNRRDVSPCRAACNIAEGECMARAHTSAERQQCIADKNECVRACVQ